MEKFQWFLVKMKEYFSRKFILAGTTLGLGYHLVLEDKDITGWSILAGVVLGFYNGSNVAEKITTLRTEKIKLKTKEMADGDTN